MKKISIVNSLVISIAIALIGPFSAFAAGPPAINLGSIDTNNFVILAQTTITDANPSVSALTGNIGLSPAAGSLITGVSCTAITGSIYEVDNTYTGGYDTNTTCKMSNPPLANKTLVDNAVLDMGTAYTNASAPATPAGVGPNLNIGAGTVGTMTLVPGVYTWGSNVTITNDVTLSGAANDVWVFQISGTLDLASGKKILLSGGAQAKNIFWQVAGATTLITGSHMEGIILDQTNIAIQAGATLNGRALAQTAVTLIGNTIGMSASAAPVVVAHRSRTTVPAVPIIGLLKVPAPLSLPNGAGKVTYKYTLWDVAKVQRLTDITLVDDKCSPVVLTSGDTNRDSFLDMDEQWIYTCTATVNNTTTNTAVATAHSTDGYYNTAIATAIATVVVGAPVQPPIINIVKVPSQLTPFPYGGGDITYTYTVTNPGVVSMSNITVADDKCSNVYFISGDNNGNNLLDVGESWIYSCKTKVQVSTSGVANAIGSANNFKAVAYSFVNVLVDVPLLPNTGVGIEGVTISWFTIVLLLVIVFLSAWLYTLLSKSERKTKI